MRSLIPWIAIAGLLLFSLRARASDKEPIDPLDPDEPVPPPPPNHQEELDGLLDSLDSPTPGKFYKIHGPQDGSSPDSDSLTQIARFILGSAPEQTVVAAMIAINASSWNREYFGHPSGDYWAFEGVDIMPAFFANFPDMANDLVNGRLPPVGGRGSLYGLIWIPGFTEETLDVPSWVWSLPA